MLVQEQCQVGCKLQANWCNRRYFDRLVCDEEYMDIVVQLKKWNRWGSLNNMMSCLVPY